MIGSVEVIKAGRKKVAKTVVRTSKGVVVVAPRYAII